MQHNLVTICASWFNGGAGQQQFHSDSSYRLFTDGSYIITRSTRARHEIASQAKVAVVAVVLCTWFLD